MLFLQYGITICASYVSPNITLQKRAVRLISHQTLLYNTTSIFKTPELLHLTFVFESLSKLTPHFFHNYFSLKSSIHSYEARHSTHVDVYVDKKNILQFGLRYIQYMGAKLWNDLPLEIRNSSSKVLFKRMIKVDLQNAM